MAGKEQFIPHQSKDSSPTIPTYTGRKKERGKMVEDN